MAKSRLNFGTLYTNGDSWTAGHFIAPKLQKEGLEDCNHKSNDFYRLKYAWPAFTAFRLGVNVVNGAHAGASNDGIVRRTITDITKLLKTTPAKDIIAVIGWSSPERRDFFYKSDTMAAYDTLYPAELHHWKDDDNDIRNEFYRNYVLRYWNEEEYYTRHMLHVITLANFFKVNKIKFKFFNAFYERLDQVKNKIGVPDYVSPLNDCIESFFVDKSIIKNTNSEGILEQYKKIYSKHDLNKTFREYLINDCIRGKKTPMKISKYLIQHPTKLGHRRWGEYVGDLLRK